MALSFYGFRPTKAEKIPLLDKTSFYFCPTLMLHCASSKTYNNMENFLISIIIAMKKKLSVIATVNEIFFVIFCLYNISCVVFIV